MVLSLSQKLIFTQEWHKKNLSAWALPQNEHMQSRGALHKKWNNFFTQK